MSFQSGLRGRWQQARQLPGRIPLRIKLITALLALVAIALAAISVAGLSYLSGYLLRQTDAALPGAEAYAVHCMTEQGSQCQQRFTGLAAYWLPDGGQLVTVLTPIKQAGFQPQAMPGPAVQSELDWLAAHPRQPTTLPAQSGAYRWRVAAYPVTFTIQSEQVSGIFIVGQDATSVYNTVGNLANTDLIVSAVVLVGLAIVGVTIVRSSLQPLADMEHTAGAIAAGDLAQRVPDRDPRTEVGRLSRSLNIMLTQIETAFHARERSEAAARESEEQMRRFLADASHELRTPLTAIRGFAEYYRQRGGIANGAPRPGPAAAVPGPGRGAVPGPGRGAGPEPGGEGLSKPDLDRMMHRVEQESARMGVLVEDMLLLARLDQQRPIERHPVDLLTLTADAVQDARMLAPDRPIGLKVGSGTAFLVLGDEARLRQVIGNLMANALTHTPDGTPIDVQLLAERNGRLAVPSVILEVADQGPGLTREQADRVFERFYRADQSRVRKTGGAGLGLAIVAALVAAHGGTVGLDTVPGDGARFRITLPLAAEAT